MTNVNNSSMGNIFKSLHNPVRTISQKKGRKISISRPTVQTVPAFLASINTYPSGKSSNVILDVIQDYLPNELSEKNSKGSRYLNVTKGDIVQFLAKAENNLILVKLVNRIGEGLVPSRCVSVNESLTRSSNPNSPKSSHTSSLDSLPETNDDSIMTSSLSQASLESAISLASETQPLFQKDSKNLYAVKGCKVVSINSRSNRIWYRLDCELYSGHKRLLCRYYQDFYSLQLDLLDGLKRLKLDYTSLPYLPGPNRIASTDGQSRCDEFNNYLDKLFTSKNIPEHVKNTVILDGWLTPRAGDLMRTPAGSLFKFYDSQDSKCMPSRQNIPEDKLDDEAIQSLLTPEPITLPKSTRSPTNSPIDPPLQRIQRSLSYSPPHLSYEAASPKFVSGPSTPCFMSTSTFNSPLETKSLDLQPTESPISFSSDDVMKLKILYKDDCYVIKCHESMVDSIGKLHGLVRSKLQSVLPTNRGTLHISQKQENNVLLPLNGEEIYQKALRDLKIACTHTAAFDSKKTVAKKCNRKLVLVVNA